jgi:hypothetical protein
MLCRFHAIGLPFYRAAAGGEAEGSEPVIIQWFDAGTGETIGEAQRSPFSIKIGNYKLTTEYFYKFTDLFTVA